MTERAARSRPRRGPLDAVVDVPGSKSIANRALVCAALADGDSRLRGVPGGDDTVAMVRCLQALGVGVVARRRRGASVAGTGGRLAAGPIALDAGLAGTTSRFVTARRRARRRAGHDRRRAAAAAPADGPAARRPRRARRRRRAPATAPAACR